jgi:hypothetical protein
MRCGAGALVLAAVCTAHAAVGGADVTQPALNAAFLFNFAKFTEWPAAARKGPLNLCVLKDDASERALAKLVADARIDDRPLQVESGVTRSRLRGCHVLYIGDVPAAEARAIVADLRDASVLTVSNGEKFARHGGVIGLVIDAGKMRFAVNNDAAQRAGIKLAAQLLSLATLVKDDPDGAP